MARSTMSVIEDALQPPSYSDPFLDNISQRSSRPADLPAYYVGSFVAQTRRTFQAVPKVFEYKLKHKAKLSAVVTVIAEEALSKHVPTFLERSPIKGKVKLIFDKPSAVQAVVVSAHGQVITGPSTVEKLTFVDISSILWSPAMGDPRLLGSDSVTGPNSSTNMAKFTGKLEGEYNWDFSLDLPKEVLVPYGPGKEPQVFSLPQTFYERLIRVKVAYQVVVRIVRSKLLRQDPRIAAPFGYIPIQRPEPFSSLRRLSYEEGIPLLGPTVDPTGWYAQKQIQIEGKVFNNRSVNMGCTLFLAKPLCYTRSSVIPLIMLLESQDIQALDLLSSPKSIVVRLRRLVKYHSSGDQLLEPLAWRDVVEYPQLATWWPSTETSADDSSFLSKRYINGELHLSSDMKPTSVMAHFRLEYAVVIFPFDTVEYEPPNNEPLLEQPVEIGTAFGLGPRPMRFAPPEYESSI